MSRKINKRVISVWIKAIRPKTLSGAAAPVILACSLSCHICSLSGREFEWWIAVCAMLFAIFMQIVANLANDYVDFKKGSDREDRIGPERLLSTGKITLSAMKKAIAIASVASVAVGLPLVMAGEPGMIFIGALCLFFAFLYSTHFSYSGLGDLLVILFFGLVPVAVTVFLLTGTWSLSSIAAGFAMGFATDTLLVVNNVRDVNEDRISGKKTVVVRFGEKNGRRLYILCGIIAILSIGIAIYNERGLLRLLFLVPYILLHTLTSLYFYKEQLSNLNFFFGKTSRNILLFSLFSSLSFLI